jgi:hypothetical protein
MTLTSTLRRLLPVLPIALTAVYWLAPSSPFRSPASLALAVLLVALLYAVVVTRDSRSAPFDLLVVAIVGIFCLIRIPVLWLAPWEFIYHGEGFAFSQTDLPWTLAFLCIGTIAAVAGFRLGAGWRSGPGRPAADQPPLLVAPVTVLLVIGGVYFAIHALQWAMLGNTAIGRTGEASGGLLFMRHFISLYAATGIGLAVGLDQWHRFDRSARLQFCAFVVMFVVYTIAGGARSGLFTLLVMVLLYNLIRFGNVRFGVRPLVTVLVAGAMAAILFPAATAIRSGWVDGRLMIDATGQARHRTWLAAGVMGGVNRLNGLDPLLLIVGRKERQPLREWVNGEQVVKSAVNLIVPSGLLGREPFPEVLPSSRVFTAVYRSRDRAYINTYYQTDMWTFWGAAFAVGGWRYGPLLMFGIALALGAGFRFLVDKGGHLGLLWQLWWLHSSYRVLISYGFDVDFAAAVSLLVAGIVVVLVLRPKPVLRPVLAFVAV